MDRLIHGKQSPRHHRSDFLRVAVARIGIEIFLNSKQRVGAGTRTVKLHNSRQGPLEKTAGSTAQSVIAGPPENRAQRPHRASVTIFRTRSFVPPAIIAEEISEPARGRI